MTNQMRIFHSTYSNKILFICAVSVLLTAWGGATRAQDTGLIEEIIVQAQRRSENIQDVPISVTAFTGDFIVEHGMDDITQLAPFVANFNITQEKTIGNTKLNIRGIGSDGNTGIEPSVAVFVDGVYRPRGAAVISSMVDLQSFEALRGPQGVQFGRNTPVGAIVVTTGQPTQEFAASLRATLGSDDKRGIRAMINGAVTDDLSARAAIYVGGRDGYTYNPIDDRENDGRDEEVARVSLRYEPSDDFDLTIIADKSVTSGGFGDPEFLTLGNETANPRTGVAIPRPTTSFIDAVEAAYGVRLTDTELDHVANDTSSISEGKDKNWGVSANANWQIGGGHTLNVIGSYREWDLNTVLDNAALPLNVVQLQRGQSTDQYSFEARILSDVDQALTYTVGLFYYNEEYDFNDRWTARPEICSIPRFTAPTGRPSRVAACLPLASDNDLDAEGPFHNELDSYAVYGSATYHFNDQLSLSAGARYTRDEKDATQMSYHSTDAMGNAFFDNFRVSSFVGERTDEEVTWNVTAQYRLNDDMMMFATASTGFKSGGFVASQNASGRIFDPETSDNYEFGLKSDWADGRVRANISVFQTELTDQQTTIFNVERIGFDILNAGEVRQRGIEADLVFVPVDPLTINASVGYIDSEFLEFDGVGTSNGFGRIGDLPGNHFALDAAGNVTTTVVQDLTGRRRHDSPEWQSAVSATWRQAVSNSSRMEWFIGGDWFYIGAHNKSADLGPLFEEPSRSLFNVRAGLGADDGKWTLSFIGKNITDEKFCTGINNQSFGPFFGAGGDTAVSTCDLGAPDTYAVEYSMNFD